MHKVTIDGKTVSISRFGAKEGWKLVRKLSAMIAPAMAEIGDDNYGAAIDSVIEKLPEDEFMILLDQLTQQCLVDDAKYNEKHLGDYMFTIKVMKAVLEYNFSDFFSPIKEALAGFAKKAAKE